MDTENIYDAYRKGIRIIESCERPGHLVAARKYIARVNKLDKLLGRKREKIVVSDEAYGLGLERFGLFGAKASFEVGDLLLAYRSKERKLRE